MSTYLVNPSDSYSDKVVEQFFHELSEEDKLALIEQAGFLPLKKDVVRTRLSYKNELIDEEITRDGAVIWDSYCD